MFISSLHNGHNEWEKKGKTNRFNQAAGPSGARNPPPHPPGYVDTQKGHVTGQGCLGPMMPMALLGLAV